MANAPRYPRSDEELGQMSDSDLAALREALAVDAEKIRDSRKILALEAERRAGLPKKARE